MIAADDILEDSQMVTIGREGAGIRIIARPYTASRRDVQPDVTAFIEGEAAEAFEAALADMRQAHTTEGNMWFNADWDNTLFHLCDDHLAAQNPEFAAWREAARALGWTFVERDPSPDETSRGPELHHAETDRVMPIGAWRLCVLDLGYSSPEEVMAEKRGAPVEEAADEPESP